MTPEGKIKARVRALLDACPDIYYEMYVPTGYGKSGLDFSCCVRGHALYIETKARGEELRPRQRGAAVKMLAAGGTVFCVSDDSGLDALARWLVNDVFRAIERGITQ